MDRKHTDKEYEGELVRLRERVLLMGARVEEMVGLSLKAYAERDVQAARLTIEIDRRIDQLELELDELCLHVLARRQPVASDLRLITSTLKLVTDLERIGDLCVNICERVLELSEDESSLTSPLIPRMAETALGMLHDSLDAFVAGDVLKAENVVERDRVVDANYAQLFPELVARMMSNPKLVFPSTRLLSIGKCLERIADHCTNIAEMVVFMVRGKDVRHSGNLTH